MKPNITIAVGNIKLKNTFSIENGDPIAHSEAKTNNSNSQQCNDKNNIKEGKLFCVIP